MVSTPIGNARDITLRALDVLKGADVLAAEDTRSLKRLMAIHGIDLAGRPVVAYHDQNGARMRPRLLQYLADGKSVAYAPEAGTPTVSDPGMTLAREAQAAGAAVTAVPGASAALAALTVAGLPTDRFLFAGFLPATASGRKAALKELAGIQASIVLYESPNRVAALLADAADILGVARAAVLCRELTKKFEESRHASLGALAQGVQDAPPRGEIVLVIGKPEATEVSDLVIDEALSSALETLSVRDAAAAVAADFNVGRRRVYQMAMAKKQEG